MIREICLGCGKRTDLRDCGCPAGTALAEFAPETPATPQGARYFGPRWDTNDLTQARELVDLLTRCWEYIDDHSDVVDNPNGYGAVAPNQAMQLAGKLRQMLDTMGHPVA